MSTNELFINMNWFGPNLKLIFQVLTFAGNDRKKPNKLKLDSNCGI